MHLWNRDALKRRIEVITNEAKSNLNSVQSRLDQVESQLSTEQQRFKVQLTAAQRATKEITIKRDQLVTKIEQLKNVSKRETVDWEVCYCTH